MIRRPPRSTHCISSAASDVYKRQVSTQSTWGESQIPLVRKAINRVFISPKTPKPLKGVITAIKDADAVILGPGSLYTSVIPNLLVEGVADALRDTQAVKIYICNVMTQPGETDNYTASQHVKAIIEHAGQGCIDYVVINVQNVTEVLQSSYAKEGAFPVIPDIAELEEMGIKVVKAKLISGTNLVRHDPIRLSRTIMSMVYKLKYNSEHIKLLDYYLISESIKNNNGD
eukprot:TRINITY_DN14253_c0_g2_i1.p1 TRINITY_DN14253_c0_g2~~TRINITY_DN14253_c0_g2_i1.p1  ORF type:complete len:229 (+),score=30.22 TRINITY_DN14253_c0_g2_i1:96-782(+)